MKAYLASSEGKSISLAALCDIGRHENCQIMLKHKEVSRRHTLICQDRHAYWLVDLNSRNGTWLNGVRIFQPVRLQNGDEIQVVGYSFRYFVENTAAPKKPPMSVETTEPTSLRYAPTGHAAIVLGQDHELRIKSEEAQRLLVGYFNFDANFSGLPIEVTQWLSEGRARTWPLVVKRNEQKLVLRYCDGGDGQHLVFLTEEEPALGNSMLKKLGLTDRECEVVRWLAAGKRNEEIALILEISHRTVEKHVQRILEKLGAETRSAAVSMILQRQGTIDVA